MDFNLKQNVRAELENKKAKFDLDTFGEIMDGVIRKSKIGLLVTKEADSEDWKVQGAGCGAVMDFYIFLNALIPIYLKMLEEMHGGIDSEKLADALCDQMNECLVKAAEEGGTTK